MKTRILLITTLFGTLAMAAACGNSPVNSNNAVKPASTVSSVPAVGNNSNAAVISNSSMPNSSRANKPAAANPGTANNSAARKNAANPAAADN